MFNTSRKRIKKLELKVKELEDAFKIMQKQHSREFTTIYAKINEIENYINEQVDEIVFPN